MKKEEHETVVRVQRNGTLALPASLLKKLELKENDALKVVSQNRSYIIFLKKEAGDSGNSHHEGTVTFCGTIEGFGIADLFSVLNMTQKTGILTVTSQSIVKSIYFRKGEIVFAASNQQEDKLGHILYSTGKLTWEQLQEAEKSITTDKRFGALLIQMELIAPKDLWWGVKYQLEEIIFSVFSFSTGDFLFIEGGTPQEDLVRFSLNTQNLLMEGFRRLDEWKLISEKFPSKDLILEIEEKTSQVELTPTMQKVLTLVDGKANISEIIRKSQLGEFNAYKILYQLLNADILHIAGKEVKPEEKEDEGTLKLKRTIEKYSRLYSTLYDAVKKEKKQFDALGAFNSFFSDQTGKLQKLFKEISLDDAGGLDIEKLLNNVKGLKLLESEGFSKIAGLNELFISQLLLEGLNELLNFEFFTVKNSLPSDKAEKIIKDIKEIQHSK